MKIYGAGQWLEEKHGAKSRVGWRKLHLTVDADSGEIIAHSLTDQESGNASQLDLLLDQIDDEIDQFTADGAYDGEPSYDQFCVIAQARGSLFHRARMRWNEPTPRRPPRETITLQPSKSMAG